jgi:hypothetical protein
MRQNIIKWFEKGGGMAYKTLVALVLAAFMLAAVTEELWAMQVGSLIKAEGPVELLRQGKLPALPAKVHDGLEPGDVIRTKSGGRAQVRFIDDTVLTIAPGSKVVVSEYLYDISRSFRRAVLKVFRGLTACAVSRLLQAEQPTFLMQTHTASLGVRGTKWYTLLGATYTAAFNETGVLEVCSLKKEITKKVLLKSGETSTVVLDQPPTDPKPYPYALRRLLENWLENGVPERLISMNPLELPWLKLPQFPEKPEELPEGLFVPPAVPSPGQSLPPAIERTK